ncbi:tudor domain-containing protein 5-like [Amphibalanus amphitrite]|uniref:tudor domain-containing protein 5-like n=1 Tax=Amphibalanus amphitrite TaxID=1232801 RepID=UPI001C90BA84|nr:tudor domain-containing protein 5-like [Amphibalanus amphitrite]
MDSHGRELLQKVKKDVRSVLITESGGMPLEKFLKVYRELTNTSIPYRRLGFYSPEELLLDATDVCRCERLPGGQLHLRPVCDSSTQHVLKMVERSRRPKTSGGRRRGAAGPRPAGPPPESESPWRPAGGSVPVEARESILRLVAEHPQGIYLDEFNQKHLAMVGHAIAYITLGFFSLKGLMESIPELVRLKETPTGDKVFPIPAPGAGSSATPSSAAEAQDASPATAFLSFEDSVRGFSEELVKVISAQSECVKVSDVPNLYYREFGRGLDYQQQGFTSLLEALASLGAPFHLEKRDDDWHVSVRRPGGRRARAATGAQGPAAAGDTGRLHSPRSDAAGVVPSAAGGDAARSPVPPARFAIQQLVWLEEGRQVATETGYPLLEVVVTHARSPGEFFFRLGSSGAELVRLEAALAAVYGGQHRAPAMRHWTAGRPLAARTHAGWRRAVLLGRAAEQVKVYLVDTGARLLLSLEAVRPLDDQFLKLPALAHEGSLARVAPPHGIWSRPAQTVFDKLVRGGVPLMATVLQQSQYVSALLLCDTRGETDVHVGDELVSAGAAVVQPQHDWPPATLRTPDSRLLSDLYAALGAPDDHRRPAVNGEVRTPPEGAELLSPTSRQLPEADHRDTGLVDRINALKIQCYDAHKQFEGAPAGPRRAALRARHLRLEAELQRLQASR